MKVYKAYIFRLYPDNNPIININKFLGSSRFIYNYFLNKKYKRFKEQYSNSIITKQIIVGWRPSEIGLWKNTSFCEVENHLYEVME